MVKCIYSNREESDFLAEENKEENSERFRGKMGNMMFAWVVWECLVPFLHFWYFWFVAMKDKEEQESLCGCRKEERQSVKENVKKKLCRAVQ